MNYRLNVCLPCRDRTTLTKKCIESIHINSKNFSEINIYAYDNISIPDQSRLKMFSDLLNQGRIKYYSFDTSLSTLNCFPKPVIFNRWIDMMMLDKNFRTLCGKINGSKDIYMLSDNDMIYGPQWDEYMLSALEEVDLKYKSIKYLVKYPGGITKKSIDNGIKIKARNIKSATHYIDVILSSFGGGSGFWFMSYNMLQRLKWDTNELIKVYNKFKGHDINTWDKLSKENRGHPYVATVVPDNMDENPLVIHLGNEVGSICNSLNRKDSNYDSERLENIKKDEAYLNMSIDEIWKNNKDKGIW
jgi:hypothetical protein